MADDKKAREKQARNEEDRQREREMQEARDRGDEPEPVQDDTGRRLGGLDDLLADHDYPVTAEELADAHGDREVEVQDGTKSVAEVLRPVDDETYDSPDDARDRIQGLLRR